jgi:hypothetical protein
MSIRYEKGELVYVSPGSVSFSQEQCRWLLHFYHDLEKGLYVPEGVESTGRSGRNNMAPHEQSCQIYAELNKRLSMTGLDRYVVEEMYADYVWEDNRYRNPFPAEIAKKIHKDEAYVIKVAQSVISYIGSGPCPRWVDCKKCKHFERCTRRNKGRRPWAYNEWKECHTRDIVKVKV